MYHCDLMFDVKGNKDIVQVRTKKEKSLNNDVDVKAYFVLIG